MANKKNKWIGPSKKKFTTFERVLIFLFLISTFFIAFFINANYGKWGCACISLGSGPILDVEWLSSIQDIKLFSEILFLFIPSLILFYGVIIFIFLLEKKQVKCV